MVDPKMYANQTLNLRRPTCEPVWKVDSGGYFSGDNPFSSTLPILMAQFIVIFFLYQIIGFLVKPLRQSVLIAPFIAGLIIAIPLHDSIFHLEKSLFFPPRSRLMLRTLVDYGFTIHLFVLGVQVDSSILIKSTGLKKATSIGLLGWILAFVFSALTRKILPANNIPAGMMLGLESMLMINATTWFISTNSLLQELNILNTELGRLASSASLVSDIVGWIALSIVSNLKNAMVASSWKPIFFILSFMGYLLFIYFVLRPLVNYMLRKTPEGEPMNENHIFVILIFVLLVGFGASLLGLHPAYGCFYFGSVLPAGPPLGSFLVQRLDTFCSNFVLPLYFTYCGMRIHLTTLPVKQFLFAESVLITSYIGKFIGTILPSLWFGISITDASLLALVMCYKGVYEIGLLNFIADPGLINHVVYTLNILTMMVFMVIVVPFVSCYYDPFKRFTAYKRRSVLHSKNNLDLNVLVCIHNEGHVPPVIKLIEALTPTRGNPITVYILQLIELVGRSTSILVPHDQRHEFTSYEMTRSEPVVNAFEIFAQSNRRVMLHHFTAVAPCESMHLDICNLSMDKKINMVIIPFHKQRTIEGAEADSSSHIRALNINVIDKAPCSVGVLVDRTYIGGTQSILTNHSAYRIAMLFLGGADDQEALAFSRRLAEHPNISLTLVWFKPCDHERYNKDKGNNDLKLMDEFRANAVGNKRIAYREVTVEDGSVTTQIIRAMGNDFELFIVGRHHRPNSPVTLGLDGWGECPELGIIGDMLATSYGDFSVLVVQQQLVPGFDRASSCPKDSTPLIKEFMEFS